MRDTDKQTVDKHTSMPLTWTSVPVAEPGLPGWAIAGPSPPPGQQLDGPLPALEAAAAGPAAGGPVGEVAPRAVHCAVCREKVEEWRMSRAKKRKYSLLGFSRTGPVGSVKKRKGISIRNSPGSKFWKQIYFLSSCKRFFEWQLHAQDNRRTAVKNSKVNKSYFTSRNQEKGEDFSQTMLTHTIYWLVKQSTVCRVW